VSTQGRERQRIQQQANPTTAYSGAAPHSIPDGLASQAQNQQDVHVAAPRVDSQAAPASAPAPPLTLASASCSILSWAALMPPAPPRPAMEDIMLGSISAAVLFSAVPVIT